MLLLYEYRYFFLYEHRDMDGFGYRNVYRVRLRNWDVLSNQIRYFDRNFYRIWNFLFYCDGYFLFNHNWVWFWDVHRNRYFLLDLNRDVNFDRDGDFLFYSVRDWVRDRYFDFLRDRDRFDFFFFLKSIATSEGMSFQRPAVAEIFVTSEGMPHVSQTMDASFHCFVLLLLFCQSQGHSQKKGADLNIGQK
jgi:hypothetical protein